MVNNSSQKGPTRKGQFNQDTDGQRGGHKQPGYTSPSATHLPRTLYSKPSLTILPSLGTVQGQLSSSFPLSPRTQHSDVKPLLSL